MEILNVRDCSRIYGSGALQVKALDHVSFTVNKGEFVAIVGPSGSGKSTLMHLLGGVDRPSQGQIIVDGTEITALQEEKLAVILGTEGDGLMQETMGLCDYTVKIPMAQGGDSLNVAAASAVAFWQLGKR